MPRGRRRKCRHCGRLYEPDPRNRWHQMFCSQAPCQQASKRASQRRWARSPVAETWRAKSDGAQVYAFSYQYDAAGNRLAMRRETTAGAVYESSYYAYGADNALLRRREQAAGVDTYFSYDLNGALARMWDQGAADATYFEYGPHGLVTKVTPPVGDGQPWEFSYDGRLNRYKIVEAGTTRYLLWDGLNCLEKRNNDGTLHSRYSFGYSPIYGIGNCVEIFVPGAPDKTYTLVMDHRGTAHVLLDQAGTEVGRRNYDAFGVLLGETGSWPVDLGYQSNWQTVKIGSKWWGLSAARLYDFATGRFTQRDPLPSLTKVVSAGDGGNTLGFFGRTKFARTVLREWRKAVRNTGKYAEWYLNAYRAFSDDPLTQLDRNGFEGDRWDPVFNPGPDDYWDDEVGGWVTGPRPTSPAGQDIAKGAVAGVFCVGVEMTKTGEVRLNYDELAAGLDKLGLTKEEGIAARKELTKQFYELHEFR